MILTIRLDDIMRVTPAAASRHLVTRPTGAAVRDAIQVAIAASPAPTTRLDFGEVEVIDFSCADEIVAKLLLATENGRYVVVCNVDDHQAEAIDHVLDRQDLTIVALPRAGPPCVLGRTTPDLRAAFAAVLAAGPGDTTRLASHLAWSLERTADALQTLALRRLVVAASGTFTPLPLQ
jgi:hypothetical protein